MPFASHLPFDFDRFKPGFEMNFSAKIKQDLGRIFAQNRQDSCSDGIILMVDRAGFEPATSRNLD